MLRKAAVSTFLLAFALYIFLPTPDELVIYPVGGLFLAYVFHLSLVDAFLMITLLYYGSGVLTLAGALLIGGKPMYRLIKEKYLKSRFQHFLKRTENSKKVDS